MDNIKPYYDYTTKKLGFHDSLKISGADLEAIENSDDIVLRNDFAERAGEIKGVVPLGQSLGGPLFEPT